MTGKQWMTLLLENKEAVLIQMRPHWKDASHNIQRGVEVKLYLNSNGDVVTLVDAVGSNSWLPFPKYLPLGSSHSDRPGFGVTESDIIDQITSYLKDF